MDARQRTIQVIDARAKQDRWTYDDAVNKPTRHIEAAGSADEAVTKWEWGGLGQLEKAFEPFKAGDESAARVTDYAYRLSTGAYPGADGGAQQVYDLVELVPPKGAAGAAERARFHTTWDVDSTGRVLGMCEPATPCRTYEYVPGSGGISGLVAKETDPQGNSVRYLAHDPNGLPRQMIDERGKPWGMHYDAVGNLLAIRDPRGASNATPLSDPADSPYTARYEYDRLDRKLRDATPKRSALGQFVRRSYGYDSNDNRTSVTDGTGAVWQTAYTKTDQVQVERSPAVTHHGEAGASPEEAFFEYDPTDQVAAVRRPESRTASGAGYVTRYGYDLVDQMIVERKVSDQSNPAGGIHQLVTSWAYDLRGNQTGMADPRTNVEVDDESAAANAADPVQQRLSYVYDVADRRTSEVEDPNGLKLTTTSTYDEHDNVRTVTSPRGNDSDEPDPGSFKTTYDYDDRDLRVAQTDPLDRRTEWCRREDGRVERIVSPRGTTTSADCDARNLFATKLTYDAAGDIATRTMPRHPDQYGPTLTVTYERNAVGDPEQVTDGRGHQFTNTFLDAGQLRTTDRPSWWIYDARQGAVRERTEGDGKPAGAGRDLPSEQGNGDFGKTEPQAMPELLPRAGDTQLDYDQELRLTGVTDAAGTTQQIGYDATGRMTTRTMPYKGAPNPLRDTCASGVEGQEPTTGPIVMTWAYDRNGNRRAMRDGRCQDTTWDYDQFDRLLTTTAPAGWDSSRAVTTASLDRNGNTTRRALPRDPESAFERMSYDSVDRLESMIEPFDADAPRSEWRYRYDANNNKIREIRPRSLEQGADLASFTTRMSYDEADQLQTSTNGAGRVTELDYDRDGNQTAVRAPGAERSRGAGIVPRVTRRTFDGRGLPWTETTGTGPDARTTVTEFDANANLRRQVNPRGIDDGLPADPDVAPNAPMTTTSVASRHATVNEYTEDDLLRARYLPWDSADDGERWKQTTTYDSRGWPEEVSEIFNWTGSNGPAVRTRYEYRPTGWVSRSIDKDGSPDPQELTYDYDLAGNQIQWASPGRTRRVEREFLPNGELEQRRAVRTDRAGMPVTGETRTYEYARNPAGELTGLIDRNAPRADAGSPATRTTSITRDVVGRIRGVNESWDGGRDTVYRYKTGGLIEDVAVDGRITPAGAFEGGRRMSYEYDILDRVTDVAVRQGGAPAAEDRVTQMTYWPSDAQRQLTKANRTVESRYFADDGRITSRTSSPDSPGGADDRAYAYTYDVNGNRARDERGDYTYNARDQLTSWDKTGAGSTADPDRNVTYRPAGDGRMRSTSETFSAPGSVSTTRTTTNTYIGERLDRAAISTTAGDGSAVPDGRRQLRYDYDIFGSLLTIKTAKTADPTPPASAFETSTQYTYDSFERLLSSRDDQDDDGEADGDHDVYCYDALDRRDRRVTGIASVDNTDPDSFEAQRTACRTPPSGAQALDYSYLGLGEQLTRENTDTGKGPRTYDYTPGGMRLGQRARATSGAAAKFRPYESDAQGSVIALEDPDRSESTPADDDGDPAPEPADRYQLDPYGDTANETTLAPAAKDNPFRYQSHYLDAGTGTYDMQARAYRPSLGRFLTQDRFEDPTADLTLQQDPLTNNRYAFLAGNPTNPSEYDGHAYVATKFGVTAVATDSSCTVTKTCWENSTRPVATISDQALGSQNTVRNPRTDRHEAPRKVAYAATGDGRIARTATTLDHRTSTTTQPDWMHKKYTSEDADALLNQIEEQRGSPLSARDRIRYGTAMQQGDLHRALELDASNPYANEVALSVLTSGPIGGGARAACSALCRLLAGKGARGALSEVEIGITLERILGASVRGKVSKSLQFARSGGTGRANRDFDDLSRGVDVVNRGRGLRTATLSNGTKINVRPFSSGRKPTLEIDTPGNPLIKIRY